MKKLLLFSFLIFFNTEILSSTIVFLQGTGCAGKTSLCREIQKLDSNWKAFDEKGYLVKNIEQEFNDMIDQIIES